MAKNIVALMLQKRRERQAVASRHFSISVGRCKFNCLTDTFGCCGLIQLIRNSRVSISLFMPHRL